jgi:hypothetical protein
MDQDTLIEKQIDDGAKFVDKLSREGVEVTAAFWLKASDDSQWYFYIASPA